MSEVTNLEINNEEIVQEKNEKTFTEEEVQKMVADRMEQTQKEQSEIFQNQLNEQLSKLQQEWEDKYTILKDKYVSEESKKKLEEEELRAKMEKEKVEKEMAIKAEKERLEKERLEFEVKKTEFIRLEVSDEMEVPKHLRKYISGKTKEEMTESAKIILSDLVKTNEEFDRAVQEAVEKKFANDATGFKKSSGTPKLTLEEFQKMTTDEKLELMDNRKEEFERLLREKREQSQY